MVDATHQSQHDANPYRDDAPVSDPGAAVQDCVSEGWYLTSYEETYGQYCQFAIGWYTGYVGFVVLDIAAGTKGLNKASNTDEIVTDLGTASNRVDDFAQQVHRWGDSYSQQVNARLIADGGRNVDDLPTPTAGSTAKGSTAAENVRTAHWNSLTESERSVLVSRLSQSSNPEASVQFLNAIDDTADVRFLLEEDVSTLNRLTDWHANPGSHRYIDPDVSENDFVHVARNSEMGDTQIVVCGKDASGTQQVRWLQMGSIDAEVGWEYFTARHVDGPYKLDQRDATSFFPVGQTVRGETLPNTMSSSDIKGPIYDSIKHGTPTQQGQRTRYYYEPTNKYQNVGIDDMQVVVLSSGQLKTAFPLSGPAVKKWVPNLNGGEGGFIDTT